MLTVASFDAILPTQESLLNSTGVVMEQMVNTLPSDEIAMLVENMLDAVPRDAHLKLVQAKLKAIKDLVSGKLFQNEDTRSVILRISCKHLRQHLAQRDELKLCADILGEILINLHPLPVIQKEHDLHELSKNILAILIQTVMSCLDGSSHILCSIIAVLLGKNSMIFCALFFLQSAS